MDYYKKIKKVKTNLLEKMFNMVGLEYKEKENKFRSENWFMEHCWTEEEQDKFKEFGINFLRKELKMSKYGAEREMSMFILNYGWKLKN